MTISLEYQKILKEMHENASNWGRTSEIPVLVEKYISELNIESILDFGCGKGEILKLIEKRYPNIKTYGYDPAFNDVLPEKIDMVISTDVLEHIEPEKLDETINDLRNRTNIVQYHLIACHKATAVLPDGRNAHLIIKTPDWWQRKLGEWDWQWGYENVISYMKNKKKQRPMAVTKYEMVGIMPWYNLKTKK